MSKLNNIVAYYVVVMYSVTGRFMAGPINLKQIYLRFNYHLVLFLIILQQHPQDMYF